MMSVALATEDVLSETIGQRLIDELGAQVQVTTLLRRTGNGYLRSKMRSWCQMARHQPVVVLTDLDRLACPKALLDDWFAQLPRPANLMVRVAVRQSESWLLADHEAIRKLIGPRGALPPQPDNLPNAKEHLLQLARLAPREVRLDLIKAAGSISSQGIGYNARLADLIQADWSPERAAQRSPSLERARRRMRELTVRLDNETNALGIDVSE